MSACQDCGVDVIIEEYGTGEVRCSDCEYRMNLKKATRKTILYCFICINLLGLGGFAFFSFIMSIFY